MDTAMSHDQGSTLTLDPACETRPAVRNAILLLAHGTPDQLDQMAEYLQKVTGGRPMPQHVVEELQHRYAEIGLRDTPLPEGPPLTRWTLAQGRLLADHLAQSTGETRPVYVGMRNWHPYIADVVDRMHADGVRHATVLCLAPQNSRTSTGLYRRALDAALATLPEAERFTYDWIAGWADEPLLALAFAEQLWPAWAEACARAGSAAGRPVRVPILFTAHSVPCRTIRSVTTAEDAARGSATAPTPPTPRGDTRGLSPKTASRITAPPTLPTPTPSKPNKPQPPSPACFSRSASKTQTGSSPFNPRASQALRGSAPASKTPSPRSPGRVTPRSSCSRSASSAITWRSSTTSISISATSARGWSRR